MSTQQLPKPTPADAALPVHGKDSPAAKPGAKAVRKDKE
jgi:hypothetical protein